MCKWLLGSCGVLLCHGSRGWTVITGDPALHLAVGCGSSPTWCRTPGESHDSSKELCALSMAEGAIHCSDLQYRHVACWLHGIFLPLSNILLQSAKWNPMLDVPSSRMADLVCFGGTVEEVLTPRSPRTLATCVQPWWWNELFMKKHPEDSNVLLVCVCRQYF